MTMLTCLSLVVGCGKQAPSPPPGPAPSPTKTSDTRPWPRLKAIIIADLTEPETRPIDLESEADKVLRRTLYAEGRFESALADDTGACAADVKLFYGLVVNGELTRSGDQGEAKVVMEAEAHCPTRGLSAGEVETYRVTVHDEAPFSEVDEAPQTASDAVLKGLLSTLSEGVALTLYGQVMIRHADDDAVIAALDASEPAGVLMEAASEAGERKLAGALPKLAALTEHDDETVSLRAGAALGLIGVADDEAISALARMTEGPDQERHLIAVHALGDIGGERAARYLDMLAVGHPRPALREAARAAAKRARAAAKADTPDRSGHDAPPGKGAEGP